MRFAIPLTVIVAAAMANAAALEGRATKCTAKSAEALLKKNKDQKFCSQYLAKTVTVFETATVQATAGPQTVTLTSTPYTTVQGTVTGVTTSTSVVGITSVTTTTLKNPNASAQTAARMAQKTAAPKVPSYLKDCKASAIKAACGALVKKAKTETVTETITATNTNAGSTVTATAVGASGTATNFVTSLATQTAYSVSFTSAVATATASIYLSYKTSTGLAQINMDTTGSNIAVAGKPSTPFLFVPYTTDGSNPSAHGLVSGYLKTTVAGVDHCAVLATGAAKLDPACFANGGTTITAANLFSINPNFNYVYAGIQASTGGVMEYWDVTNKKWVAAWTSATATVDLFVNNTQLVTA